MIATFLWLIRLDLAHISDFFADILTLVTMDSKIEKSHRGTPPGPRGEAEAGWCAQRQTEAEAEPRVLDGVRPCDFSI